MSRPHPVDGSRGGRRSVNLGQYRAGLAAGQAARKRGGCCLLSLFLLPLLLLAALARHRAPDQSDRPDPRPNRLGAHTDQPHPFRRDLEPAAAMLARVRGTTPKETR